MFPSGRDAKNFQAIFGAEATLERMPVRHLDCHGLGASAVISAAANREETLIRAWNLMQAQAQWVLERSSELPMTERYIVIVGWGNAVRKSQGQIFKAGGAIGELRAVANSLDWKQYEETTGQKALLSRWEKDVFEERAP